MDSAYFSGRSGETKNWFSEFFLKLDPLFGPIAAKRLVLELLCMSGGGHIRGVCRTVNKKRWLCNGILFPVDGRHFPSSWCKHLSGLCWRECDCTTEYMFVEV